MSPSPETRFTIFPKRKGGSSTCLKSKLEELKNKLEHSNGKLTFAELRASVLNLEKASMTVAHINNVRVLEDKQKDLEEKLAKLRLELQAARESVSDKEQVHAEVRDLTGDLARR